MGLLQKACETYDAMAHLAGVEIEDRETLAPISHIMVRAQIEITLDQGGNFVTARVVDKNEPKIAIPVTEESAGRTSAPCPHPLCDQLGYLAPNTPTKEGLYLKGLAEWVGSGHTHPKLQAVLHYVRSGTILPDLARAEVIQLGADGKPNDEKLLVRWVVIGLGDKLSGPCWTDRALIQCFIQYYTEQQSRRTSCLCMISGAEEFPARQHPKGIIAINGNAKLISANDSSGFTYRGRFDSPEQAATIGYLSSQKAHNALRWLAVNQGVTFGGRTFLCWNPQGHPMPPVHGSMGRRGGSSQKRSATPTEYRQQLRDTLSGWNDGLPVRAGVVIAVFDAATTGRLAVTYYNELLASDFLQRLCDWEETCCWENGPLGVQSPTLFQLVSWAFGVPRNGKVETDDRILAQQMQRLAVCRVDRAAFPLDIERALVEKASNLLIYEGDNRTKLLFTTCAAIRKYHYDHWKEEWGMALDQNNCDRSYLFGRLLAIAEAVENSTYTDEDRRETNAVRMQKAFSLRPMTTWRILEEKLTPYYKQLDPGLRQYYRKLIQEIVDKLSASNIDLNQKLDDIYLLGYYHQRAYRREKSDKREAEK